MNINIELNLKNKYKIEHPLQVISYPKWIMMLVFMDFVVRVYKRTLKTVCFIIWTEYVIVWLFNIRELHNYYLLTVIQRWTVHVPVKPIDMILYLYINPITWHIRLLHKNVRTFSRWRSQKTYYVDIKKMLMTKESLREINR